MGKHTTNSSGLLTTISAGCGSPFGKALITLVGPARRTALALGRLIERLDGMLRQWPVATVSLLLVAIFLGAALMAAR